MHSISSQPLLSSTFNQPSCLFDNPLLVSSPLSPKCSYSCCCYCCCYAANISVCERLPFVNPRFLHKGLSQSILIKSSLSKRLIFHGGIRQYNDNICGFSSFGNLDGSYCYEKLHAFKERRNQRQRGFVHKMKKQFLSNVIDNDDCVNNVEVMLSLLTGEVGLECNENNDVKNRKKLNKEKKSENLDMRKEGSFGGLEGNKDSEVRSDVYASQTSSSEFNLRKGGSFAELEGDKDFEVKCGGYVGQTSSSECSNGLRKDCKSCIYEANIGVSQDWRKKSEKKLIKELYKQHSNEIVKITDESEAEGRRNQRQRGCVRKMKKQFLSNVIDDCVNDAEVKLSLLIDDVGLECNENNDAKNRKKLNKEKKSENLDLREEGSFGGLEGDKDFEVKSDVYAGQMSSSSEFDLRKGGSFVELEGDKDFEVKFGGYVGQTSSSELTNNLRKDCKFCIDEASIGVSEDWRKKSEKKMIKELCKQHNNEIVKLTVTDESGSRMKYKLFTEKSNCDKTVIESASITETEDNKDDLSKTCDQKDGGSRHSSQGSGPKGPSDEMWHVSDEWEETYNLENKQLKEDEMFMKEALLEARKAADASEVPVGAVLVKDGKIIARGYNMVEELQDSTAHAEMICIRKASTVVSSWRLLDTTLYVTLEPCPMCAGAILQARIHTVVWGAPNKLLGADGSWIRLFCDGNGGTGSVPTDIPPAPAHHFHPNMVVRRGVLAVECGEVMKHFFQLRRKKKLEPQNVCSSISVSHDHHHSNFLSKIQHAFSVIFCL